MAAPSTTTPLGSLQEEPEADAEGLTSIFYTIRRPFLGTRRGGNATRKEVRERNSMERKQRTPPRTWLHRVAAKLTISRGTKGTIKSNTGDKAAHREGTEETSRRAGFKRKPIPSFASPPNPEDGQNKNDDILSSSQSSSSHEGGTHASTHRSSTSIRTPTSTEEHSTDATKDQVWDFDDEVENYPGQSMDESNTVSPPLFWEYNIDSIKPNFPRSRANSSRTLCRTASRSF
jgi:hypothetical protein